MATASNVSVGKPKVGGAIHVAPIGTTLPTTADEALDNAFKNLGYVSEDGLTNSNSPESETIKAWGGDPVLTLMTGREDTFQYTLIESLNIDALKLVYGDSNVSGTLATGITIHAKPEALEDHVYVIDMVLRGNAVQRIVIPCGNVSAVGDITYTDGDAIGFDLTINAQSDETGATHHTYIKRA